MKVNALISAIFLSIFLSIETVLIKLVIKNKYHDSEQIIVLAECLKLVYSILIYYIYKLQRTEELEHVEVEEQLIDASDASAHNVLVDVKIERNTKLYYFIYPAIIYTISNNLTYIALGEMTPALYNLLMNLKIPITAFLAYFCVNYKINKMLLCSFLLLFLSTTLSSLKFDNGQLRLDTSIIGLIIMMLYTTCSSAGSIIMEFITKIKYKDEDINIQNIKYAICSIICNTCIIIYKSSKNQKIPFILLEKEHFILIVVSGMYGLITSYVIKHGGSILKTYATTMSIFLSALLTYIIWRTIFTWNFYVGGILCLIAIHIFLTEKKKEFIQTMRYNVVDNGLIDNGLIDIENDTDIQEDYQYHYSPSPTN